MPFAKDLGVEHFDLERQFLDKCLERLDFDLLLADLLFQGFVLRYQLVYPSPSGWVENALIVPEFGQTVLISSGVNALAMFVLLKD
jgi:hypothetical protein